MDSVTDPSLRQLLDSARNAHSNRSRAGFGSLHRHRSEDASLIGLLANLAECNAFIVIRLMSGAERRGRLVNAGTGAVELRTSQSGLSLIRTSAITSVRSATPLLLDGDGRPRNSLSWFTALATHLDRNDELALLTNNEMVSGTVEGLSRSLLVLATTDGGAIYAVVDAIEEVSISVPGSMRHD